MISVDRRRSPLKKRISPEEKYSINEI